MSLKSLLLSSDDATVRVVRRVLSELDIRVEHCPAAEAAVRKITRERFEAIIVDCSGAEEAASVLRTAKAAPVNQRALTIVLVDSAVGLRRGFEMGAHFVLHKPLSGERAKASFRAVRALMKRERRRQMRVAVQVPVECRGSGSAARFKAKTLDLCEGGMAIQFSGATPNENTLRFALDLPGMNRKFELEGELAWEGDQARVGVRFKSLTDDQLSALRQWLNGQLPEPEKDDPPVSCRLTDLSLGGCYLETNSPFPQGTRVILSMKAGKVQARAGGVVRITHPEYGMGVEFLSAAGKPDDQVLCLIEALRASGTQSPELQVEPDGLETVEDIRQRATRPPAETEDPLVELFRQKSQVSVEHFLAELRQQRQMAATK